MKIGNQQAMNDKMKMAEKRGYDTGKPSTGTKLPPKGKFKPKISKGKIGFTYTQMLRGGMK